MNRKNISNYLFLAIFGFFIGMFIGEQTSLPTIPHAVAEAPHQISQDNQSVSPKEIGNIDHIAVLVLSDKSYAEVVGSKNAPYINSLIQDFALADNYSGVSHPGLPNYIALIGGDTFGISTDCDDCHLDKANLVDQLEQAHKSWKAYMESMPSNCFIGNQYPYEQEHDPFIYFDDIRNNPERCNRIVPLSALQTDLQSTDTTPDFIWITPNICHDMHDCSVQEGDKWLSQEVLQILYTPAFIQQNSLLFITFDEGEGPDAVTNHLPTIIIGNVGKKRYVSHIPYTHYSLIHTIETEWGMPALTPNVSAATPMVDVIGVN